MNARQPGDIAFVAAVFPSEESAAIAQIRLRQFQAREAGKLRLTPPSTETGLERFVVSGPVYREDLSAVRLAIDTLQGRLVVVTT
jgi:hypothetical protein